MSGWRARAAEMLPELSEMSTGAWSVHVFLSDLHGLVRDAHRAGDDGTLARGYRFANWCLRQPERFLANAAAVSFYAHVFDDWELREEVVGWLPVDIVEHARPLWEWRLPAEQLMEVDRLLTADRVHALR